MSQYFDLLDTSGPAEDGGGYGDYDPVDDAVAEGVAAQIVDEAEEQFTDTSGFLDTGALSLNLEGLLNAPAKLIEGMVRMGVPAPKARKIVPKVQSKVQKKVAKKAARPAAPRPAPRAPMQMGPIRLPRHSIQGVDPGPKPKLLTFPELLDRLIVRQLANYSGTITAGDTEDVEVEVTRNGVVLNWSNADAADAMIVRRVMYGQDTTTVYNDQTLGAWSSKALQKVPVEPIEVTMPNKFDATLENPTGSNIRVVWTMWGVTSADANKAASRDPDVAYTIQHREIPIALAFAHGQY